MKKQKTNKFIAEMTQDGDSDQWGLIIWLKTKNEKLANKKADKIIANYNKAEK